MKGPRDLEVTILRRNRRQARFTVAADPADQAGLREILTGWLTREHWARGLWDDFEMTARETTGPRVFVTVRAE